MSGAVIPGRCGDSSARAKGRRELEGSLGQRPPSVGPSISVGQPITAMPSGGGSGSSGVADHPVDQALVEGGDARRRWTGGRPPRMKTSVGPLTTWPAT